jgi:hypothetical protein
MDDHDGHEDDGMDGFHYTGRGGRINTWEQVIAEIELEPGLYIVFAKASATIGAKYGYTATGPVPNPEVAYQATLELADHSDSCIGSLKGDMDIPGDRWESFALNLAGEITKKAKARLKIAATLNDEISVFEPRISAIKLSDLKVVEGTFEPSTFDMYPKVLAASVAAGVTPKMMRDVLSGGPEAKRGDKARG